MIDALGRIAAAPGRSGHAMRVALLVLLCLVAFLPGTANLPSTDRDESRYMQASRQMAVTGDWIDIRFQHAPRYLKPVGIYWMQAAVVKLVGGGEQAPIWAYRLVSVLSVLATVIAIYWGGVRLFGSAAGLFAGIAMAGAMTMLFEARMAKTDAALMAATTIAMVALAFVYLGARQDRPVPRAAPWVFWLAMGVGILIKGPITPLAAILTIAALLIFDKHRAWIWQVRPGPGLVLMLAVVVPWLVAITIRSGTVFWTEALERSMLTKVQSGQESHGFPPGYYALTFSLMLWPFALETLRGGLKAINGARSDPRLLFCLAWYVPFWLVFELIPTKLPHYILQAYPAMFLMMGWSLADPAAAVIDLKRWQVWLMRLASLGWAVVTLALAVLSVGLVPYVVGEVSIWGILAGIAALLAGWLGSGFRPPAPPLPRILMATLAAAVFGGILTSSVLPSIKLIWPGQRIADAFEANKPCPGSILAVTGFLEPSVVFEVGTRTVLTSGAGAARHLKADPACAMAAIEATDEPAFQAAFPAGDRKPVAVARFPAMSYTKGTKLDFALYRLPAG